MHRLALAPLLSFILFACSSNEPSNASPSTDSAVTDAADATGETSEDAATDTGPLRATCGSILVLGPQGTANTPECVACVDAKCCAEATACGAKASCMSLRDCIAGCKDSACSDACFETHEGGAAESNAVAQCRGTKCGAECANFACLGSVVWPAPTTPSYALELTLTELQSGAKIAGATVKVCKLDDAACAAPLSETTSDAEGVANVTAPSAKEGVAAYFEVSGASIMTTLFHVRYQDPATSLATGKLAPIVVGKSTFEGLTALAGVTPDASRGHVTFLAMDCAQFTAPGVSASVAAADASSTTAYIQPDGLPSTSATTTSTTGFAAVVNVPPGATTVRGTVAATKRDLGAPAPVVVRAGAITSINLVPSP